MLSPHDPKTVYYGGNVVFKTTNRGHSWDVISPDLTTDDKSKQQSSGGPVVTDNTAAEFHCTILTIAESPVTAGVVWVGTDDGNVQVTRDGGKTWTNVVKNIDGVRVYGPPVERRAGIVSFTVDGPYGEIHPHDVAQILGASGVCVRAGHHCTQPLMKRFDLMATTRASFYLYSIQEEVDRLVDGIRTVQKTFS